MTSKPQKRTVYHRRPADKHRQGTASPRRKKMIIKKLSVVAWMVVIPLLVTQAFGEWSPPLQIRELSDEITAARLVTGAAGNAFALWSETPVHGGPQRLFSRMTTAGAWGWGPPVELPDGTAFLQPPAAVAMHTDGTVLAAWRQESESPSESQIIVRKFVPGSGWGPPQKLSVSG